VGERERRVDGGRKAVECVMKIRSRKGERRMALFSLACNGTKKDGGTAEQGLGFVSIRYLACHVVIMQ